MNNVYEGELKHTSTWKWSDIQINDKTLEQVYSLQVHLTKQT